MDLDSLGLNFLRCVRTCPVCIHERSQLTLLRIFVISLFLRSSEGECIHEVPLALTLFLIYIFFSRALESVNS